MKLELKGTKEYCASVVEIGKLEPIEGSDFLAKTLVNGFQIVVRKDEVQEGDMMIYVANECAICPEFLSSNNLFDFGNYKLNDNNFEVETLIEKGYIDEARRKCGYFGGNGRVRMIRLKGCPSFGILLPLESFKKWIGVDLLGVKIGDEFDTIDDNWFVKVYVPKTKEGSRRGNKSEKRDKKLLKFDKMIPGQFSFHYDTDQLNKNMHLLKPETEVYISTKIHGTSAIFGNVKVKSPRIFWTSVDFLNKIQLKLFSLLPESWKSWNTYYDNVYSSRKVIKNQYINEEVKSGYYGTDVWGEYAELFKGVIPKGVTIYGEIFGYITGDTKMIQKDYDYGCSVGTNKLMIYRVSIKNKVTGETTEIDSPSELQYWANTLKYAKPELENKVIDYPILFQGKMNDLVPYNEGEDLRDWRDRALDVLKHSFGLEEKEPMCKNKVPREGFVLRIKGDQVKEAFKLKAVSFMEREAKLVDKGEVDMEMEESNNEV